MRRTAALSVGVERQKAHVAVPGHGCGGGAGRGDRPAAVTARIRPEDGGKEPVALRKAAGLLDRSPGTDLPETFWYSVKRRLLGPPLVNEQLAQERLSKPLALGVLSCDGISSANYGSELILHELLPFFGLAAFTLLLPMTGVILLGIALVVLSYCEVVSVYPRAGGSYVVARENFGPRVAQVAAVALMVDYIVTVAVQTAAGSQAVLSTFPVLGRPLGDKTTLLVIA